MRRYAMPLRSFSAWPYFISERPSVTLRQSFGLEARPTTSLTLRFTSYPHPTLSFSSTLLWWWRTSLCDRRCPTRVLQVTACRDRAGLCVRRQGGDTPYDTHLTRLSLLTFGTAPSPPTIPPYTTVKSNPPQVTFLQREMSLSFGLRHPDLMLLLRGIWYVA